MARASDSTREFQPVDAVTAEVREYNSLKTEIDKLSKRQKELRESLMDSLERGGYADDQGHIWIDLDAEVDGVSGLQRQRRTKRGFDQDAADSILISKGLRAQCFKTIEVIDEDAIYQALYNEYLSESDIDAIFPQEVTWALVMKK